MPKILPIEHRHQEEEAGCLAACAQMALAHWGIEISQKALNRLFDLTPAGAPASRLRRLERYGVQVALRNGTLADLIQALEQNTPSIVFVSTGSLPYWSLDTQHAVLVVGYDNDDVLIADPAFDETLQRVNKLALLLAWDEFDNRYALIRRVNL